ncbi:MAG: flavin reductase [Chloroflexi bacterium]|nr:flavin reductase [Chloroflexota bacterium]
MDAEAKKTVLRKLTYGLHVVTTRSRSGDVVNGMTANWVTQVSFEPPLVAVAVENDSKTIELLRESAVFALNVLESGQRELAGTLGRAYAKRPDKLDGIATSPGETGCPILKDALGYVECRIVSSQSAGDHTLFVGQVVAAGVHRDGVPLPMSETGFRYFG